MFRYVKYIFILKEIVPTELLIYIKIIRKLPYVMKRKDCKAYLFLLPSLLLALLFSFLPLTKSLISSFLTISQSGKIIGFAGLRNYISLFSNQAFLSSILNTIKFVILFLPLNTFLTLLAAALTREKRKGIAIPEFIFLAPLAFSLSALSLIFKEIFRGRVSVINRITGLNLSWLDEPDSAMFVLVILGIFLDFALDFILLLAAFRSMDRSVIEAAEIDGASGAKLFFSIELPAVKNVLYVTVFTALKDAVLISAPVMVLTEGGPFRSTETVMFYYYLEAFRSGNRATESTIAVLMVLLSVIVMGLVSRRRRDV